MEPIKVVIRARPSNDRENDLDQKPILEVDSGNNSVSVQCRRLRGGQRRAKEDKYTLRCKYDEVFGENTSQVEVYDTVKGLVHSAVSGVNCTVFAYGQTGTGKTYTMFGQEVFIDGHPRYLLPESAKASWGLVPRMVQSLFVTLHGMEAIMTSDSSSSSASSRCESVRGSEGSAAETDHDEEEDDEDDDGDGVLEHEHSNRVEEEVEKEEEEEETEQQRQQKQQKQQQQHQQGNEEEEQACDNHAESVPQSSKGSIDTGKSEPATQQRSENGNERQIKNQIAQESVEPNTDETQAIELPEQLNESKITTQSISPSTQSSNTTKNENDTSEILKGHNMAPHLKNQGKNEYHVAEKEQEPQVEDEEKTYVTKIMEISSLDLTEKYGINVGDNVSYVVHCSFLQIYNDQIYDLMQDPRKRRALRIREAPSAKLGKHETFVQGLSEYRVSCWSDVASVLEHGNRNRAIRATEHNSVSSRSHAILQMSVQVQILHDDGTKVIRQSKLNFADLAGCEKWNTLNQMSVHRTKELSSINNSLSTLGNVIQALGDKKRSHVPYRDSKLTRILQDSLGGNTKTVLICTLSPLPASQEEIVTTLQFADRARRILMRVRNNEIVDDSVLLARAQAEIVRLKRLLREECAKNQSMHASILGVPDLSASSKSRSNIKTIEPGTGLQLRRENNQLRRQVATLISQVAAYRDQSDAVSGADDNHLVTKTRSMSIRSKRKLSSSSSSSSLVEGGSHRPNRTKSFSSLSSIASRSVPAVPVTFTSLRSRPFGLLQRAVSSVLGVARGSIKTPPSEEYAGTGAPRYKKKLPPPRVGKQNHTTLNAVVEGEEMSRSRKLKSQDQKCQRGTYATEAQVASDNIRNTDGRNKKTVLSLTKTKKNRQIVKEKRPSNQNSEEAPTPPATDIIRALREYLDDEELPTDNARSGTSKPGTKPKHNRGTKQEQTRETGTKRGTKNQQEDRQYQQMLEDRYGLWSPTTERRVREEEEACKEELREDKERMRDIQNKKMELMKLRKSLLSNLANATELREAVRADREHEHITAQEYLDSREEEDQTTDSNSNNTRNSKRHKAPDFFAAKRASTVSADEYTSPSHNLKPDTQQQHGRPNTAPSAMDSLQESTNSWPDKPHRTLDMPKGESKAGLRLAPMKPRNKPTTSGVDTRVVVGQTRETAISAKAENGKSNEFIENTNCSFVKSNGSIDRPRRSIDQSKEFVERSSNNEGVGVDEYEEEFESFDDDDNDSRETRSRENQQGPECNQHVSAKRASISQRNDRYGNLSPQLSHGSYGIALVPVEKPPSNNNNNTNNNSEKKKKNNNNNNSFTSDDDDASADEQSQKLLDSFDKNNERHDRAFSELHTCEADARKGDVNDDYKNTRHDQHIPEARMLPTKLTFSMADLGATISIFQYRTESWYPSTVVDYDRDTDMHQIRYGDGAQSWQRLEGKRVRFIKAGDGKGTRQLRASANQRLHRRASARQRKNKMMRSRTGVVDTIVLGAYLGGNGSAKKSGVGRKRKQRKGLGKSMSQQMLPTLGGG